MVLVICKECDRQFSVKPAELARGRGKFCSRACKSKWTSREIRGRRHHHFRRNLVFCDYCGSQIRRVPYRLQRSNHHFCSKECLHIWLGKQSRKGREVECTLCRRLFYVPYWREKKSSHYFCSLECQLQWVHTQYTSSPTEPERQLEAILDKHSPDFKYNGDGRLGVTIGNFTPDFINTNGSKDIIELFGDYYHSDRVIGNKWQRGELGRIMAYNSLGFRCLIIWEHELKDKLAVVAKVKQFMEAKSK